jgi:hypothetical protein
MADATWIVRVHFNFTRIYLYIHATLCPGAGANIDSRKDSALLNIENTCQITIKRGFNFVRLAHLIVGNPILYFRLIPTSGNF